MLQDIVKIFVQGRFPCDHSWPVLLNPDLHFKPSLTINWHLGNMLDLPFHRVVFRLLGISLLLTGCSSVQTVQCTYSLSKDGGIYEHCPGKPAHFLRYMGAEEDYIELAEDLGMDGYVVPAHWSTPHNCWIASSVLTLWFEASSYPKNAPTFLEHAVGFRHH